MKVIKIFTLIISCLIIYSCENPYNEDDDMPVTNTGGNNNKPSGDNPDKEGYNTGDIVTVQEFIEKDIDCQVFVVGYIVGACTKSISYAEFEPPFTYPQALLIADDMNENRDYMVASVQLKSGSKWRRDLNLVDNPGLYRRKVWFFGFKEKYLGVPGIKSIDAFDFI